MCHKQRPIFKELSPYSGQIEDNNRWIKLAERVPWDEMEVIYRKCFDERKQTIIKKSRLIIGLQLGKMLMELAGRPVLECFYENPYFQYFCGQEPFIPKTDIAIIHHRLLSKRYKRLGEPYARKFEQEIWAVLKKKDLIQGDKLILDATVFPANITYPNDVKLLNTARE